MKESEYNQVSSIDNELAANRLRQARIDAGFLTANHAAIHFGWGINTYSLHEEGIKDFDKDTAVKYSEAFNIDGDWLSSLCRDLLIEEKTKTKIVNEEEERKRIERHKANKKKHIAAKRLLLAREEAGYSSANHAAMKFGWNMRMYLQHEAGARVFDEDTALKYSKAFNVGADWFSIDEE